MKIVRNAEGLRSGPGGIVLAAGFFDGVHLGHRAILAAARSLADERGAEAWALTFEPHPIAVLAPDHAPSLLTPGALRFEALEATGSVAGCLVLPFTSETAAQEPAAFAAMLRAALPCPLAVVAGPNWRFGRGRAGRLADLPALTGGAASVQEVPFVLRGGEPVSSSRIREAVRRGDLALATALLGRPLLVRERALDAGEGRGVGTKLGAPTANILPASPVLPPPGVYAVDVRIESGGAPRRAVANFGLRPTFPDARPDRPLLEIHIPGFSGDLHGRMLDVAWLRRLRDERSFASTEALAAQIREDVEEALRS